MDVRREMVRFDRMRHFSMQITKIKYLKSHMHGSFEISYVLTGNGQCTVGGETIKLEPGEMVLINPYEVHSFVSCGDEPLVLLTAQVHRLFLRRYVERIPKLRFRGSSIGELPEDQYRELVYLLTKSAVIYFTESESWQFDTLACGILLMGRLVSYLDWELEEISSNAETELLNNRAQRLMEYIDEHFRQKIKLSYLAEMEDISTTHLSHFFRKTFGMTFQTYLSTQRMEKALVLLRDPSVPLQEIYMRCGFSDHRYLEATCKRMFGCTVAQYRARCEQQELPDTPGAELQLYSEYRWEESLSALEQYLGPDKFREMT